MDDFNVDINNDLNNPFISPEKLSGIDNPFIQPEENQEVAPASDTPKIEDNPFYHDMMRRNAFGQALKDAEDPLARARTHQFGADEYSMYRYTAYGSDTYNKLGFSPYRDNEALYNANTTLLDDLGRSVGPTFQNAWLGFQDSLPWNTFSEIDTEAARTMERNMAIGNSTKGGVGGFFNNLMVNSGYTLGIMSEMAIEEGIYAVGGFFTGGTTWGVGAARGAVGAAKIARGAKLAFQLGKRIDKMADVNKARTAYRAMRNGALEFINPVSGVTEFVKNRKKLDGLSKFAKASTGFGEFYRDTRNLRLAWAESGLEGGMVKNQYKDDMVRDWYKKNPGKTMSDEKLLEIEGLADKAGRSASRWNLPVIFFSNKIVFDNMLKTFSPVRRMTTSVVENKFGKLWFDPKKAENAFKVTSKGWETFYKTLRTPKSYAQGTMSYFKANFAEGLQESFQETIAGANLDYYKGLYNGDPVRGRFYANLGDNLAHQFSSEGFEVFMSGFLMGGMVQPITRAPNLVKSTYQRVAKPKEYAQLKADQEKYLNDLETSLNKMYSKENIESYFAPDLENLATQVKTARGMKQSLFDGDKKAFTDLKTKGQASHIITALRTGNIGIFKQRLKEQKSLTEEEIKESHPELSKADYDAAIDVAVDRIDRIEKNYNYLNKKYPNPYNPEQYEYGSPQRKAAMAKKIAHEQAISKMTFESEAAKRTTERIQSIFNNASSDPTLKNMEITDLDSLFSMENTEESILRLALELKATEGVTEPELVKQREKNVKKLELLKKWSKAQQALKESTVLDSAEEAAQAAEAAEAQEPGLVVSEEQILKDTFDAFTDYLDFINDGKESASEEDVESTFRSIIDYMRLGQDAELFSQTMRIMTNPDYFDKIFMDQLKVNDDIIKNKKYEIRTSLEAWLNNEKIPNDLLQALDDEGIFFHPDDFAALRDEGKLPRRLYDKHTMDELDITGLKFQKFIDIITKYGIEIMDIPIAQEEVDASKDVYNNKVREKFAEDERTYNDIAEQFGFDPIATSTKLKLKDVLNTIMESKYAAPAEKALAQELLKYASDLETVTFSKTAPIAGWYSEAMQTVVDARYSSKNYKGGGLPIEYVILHQEVHRRTDQAYEEDKAFAKKIDELHKIAKDKMTDAQYKDIFGEKPLYGVDNPQDFMAEAMTNPKFQEYLGNIEYDITSESVWKRFVKAVHEAIKNFFGKGTSNTVLNEVLTTVSTKLDEGYVTSPETTDVIEAERNPGDYDKLRRIAPLLISAQPVSDEDKALADSYPILMGELMRIERERADALNAIDEPVGAAAAEVINLEKDQFVEELLLDEETETELKPEYKGKLIYATPGTGKTTLAKKSEDIIDSDDIMLEEMEATGFEKREDETVQEYIYRFTRNPGEVPGNVTKQDINNRVLDRIETLVSEGKTVLTGTVAFIKEADINLIADRESKTVKEKLADNILKDGFFTKEQAEIDALAAEAPSQEQQDAYEEELIKINKIYDDLIDEVFGRDKAEAKEVVPPSALKPVITPQTNFNTLAQKHEEFFIGVLSAWKDNYPQFKEKNASVLLKDPDSREMAKEAWESDVERGNLSNQIIEMFNNENNRLLTEQVEAARESAIKEVIDRLLAKIEKASSEELDAIQAEIISDELLPAYQAISDMGVFEAIAERRAKLENIITEEDARKLKAGDQVMLQRAGKQVQVSLKEDFTGKTVKAISVLDKEKEYTISIAKDVNQEKVEKITGDPIDFTPITKEEEDVARETTEAETDMTAEEMQSKYDGVNEDDLVDDIDLSCL